MDPLALMDEYQPRFSRNSLNILMLATLGLIVLFNLPQLMAQRDQAVLPKPAPLNLNTWQTDSGAEVWFSPYMAAESVHMELWYKAGSQFSRHGETLLLTELLAAQAKRQKLPVRVRSDQDFIQIRTQFSRKPTVLKKQIEALKNLIYFPDLAADDIQRIRASYLPTASDELLTQLYGENHQYAATVTSDSLGALTRADIQKFHHKNLHPKRLHVAFVADLPTDAARVLLERLLPISPHAASTKQPVQALAPNHARSNNLVLINWPPLQDHQADIDMAISAAILKSRYGDLVNWYPGLSNSLFQLQSQPGQALEELDTKSMLTTKRQLALKWIRQTHAADSLSRYLIHLNAYGLPQDYMLKQIQRLEEFDRGRWQQVLNTLLAPVVMADNS